MDEGPCYNKRFIIYWFREASIIASWATERR